MIRNPDAPAEVLIVDDYDDLRFLVRSCLEPRGWVVREATDGVEALNACHQHPPDVIVLDVHMPSLDGWGVLEGLQADPELREVPVILLTAHGRPQVVVEGFDRGAHDFVGKPFAPSELCARVAAAVRVKRHQDELRRRNRELDENSRTDILTGLSNRWDLTGRLAEMTSAARRHRHPLALAMIDVDLFKQVNDRFGHAAGDQVLRQVAWRLRSALRSEDVVGRWGGDEFLALLPYTELQEAENVAQRMRDAVASPAIVTDPGGAHRITVSIGCAQGPLDPERLIRAADEVLYHVKRVGSAGEIDLR